MKLGLPVYKQQPSNRICRKCNFIIPIKWLICENCGEVQSKMEYHELKYYRHKRDKIKRQILKDRKKKKVI